MKAYDFPVQLFPIQTIGAVDRGSIKVPKKFAVVRTDTDRPLGVVSDKYDLLPHKTVVDGFRKAVEDQEVSEKISLTKFGARLMMDMTFPDVRVKVAKGDEVAMHLIVKNSYDGSNALRVVLGAYRLVCSNGLVIFQRFMQFSHKHVGTQMEVRVEELKNTVGMLTDAFHKTGPVMQEMAATRLQMEPRQFFNAKRIRLPEYLAEIARQEFEKKGISVWDAYNAMTFAITHRMRKESPESQLQYGRAAWEVARREIKTI